MNTSGCYYCYYYYVTIELNDWYNIAGIDYCNLGMLSFGSKMLSPDLPNPGPCVKSLDPAYGTCEEVVEPLGGGA
jgi:hypothetical protein